MSAKSRRSIPDGNSFHVAFVKYTKSTTCCGYKQKFRLSINDPSLPALFGILLAGNDFSGYSLAGSTVVKIRKYKNVYFHVEKA